MPQQTHLLLVEDNLDDIFFLRRAIHKVDPSIDVIVLNSGNEALTFLSSNYRHGEKSKLELSLILLDLNLPKLNGLVLLEILKSHGWLRSLPVVVVSTSTEELHEVESLDLGAWDYVRKPLTAAKVAELLEKYLPQAGARGVTQAGAATTGAAPTVFPSAMTPSANANASVPDLAPQLSEDEGD